MRKWRRLQTVGGPRFVSALQPHEAALLRTMATSIQEMLDERQSATPSDPLEQITGIRTGNATAPEEATLRRLLPDFIKDTATADEPDGSAGALRSLHEPEIIDAKISAAQELLDTLPGADGRVELTEAQANAWIAAVNDMRLSLGTILGIGAHGPERLPAGHPLATHFDVYQWLTVLQEYLVLGLMDKPIR